MREEIFDTGTASKLIAAIKNGDLCTFKSIVDSSKAASDFAMGWSITYEFGDGIEYLVKYKNTQLPSHKVNGVTPELIKSFYQNDILSGITPYSQKAFDHAVKFDDVEDVKYWIGKGMSLDYSMMRNAIVNNCSGIVREFIKPGNKDNIIFLDTAVIHSKLSIVKILINEKEVDVNYSIKCDSIIARALEECKIKFYGRKKYNVEIISFLIDKGADLNFINRSGQNIFHCLSMIPDDDCKNVCISARDLIDEDVSLDEFDEYGYSPLYYALKNDNEYYMNKLICMGADINARNSDGKTIASIFIDELEKEEYIEFSTNILLKFLLSNGAKL